MKFKRYLSGLLATIMIICCFAGCTKTVEESKININEDGFEISYVCYDDKDGRGGSLILTDDHTQLQESYLATDFKIKKFAKGVESYDKPEYIEYKYNEDFVLEFCENNKFINPVKFESFHNVAKVQNLKIKTDYFVRAKVGDKYINLPEVRTAQHGPRIMDVDGVKNVRDIGGYDIGENKRVKQGLIYRCARLNESNIDHEVVEVTDKGKMTMVREMRIKSEIDLRVFDNDETGRITASPLGASVKYCNFSMPYENDIYLDNKDLVAEVFKLMADENNYPMIFHCNIGTDRTGMIAYILESLLGVSEEDRYNDYLWSNFADIGGNRAITGVTHSEYYKDMQKQKGKTDSEKAYNLLLSLGLTEKEIDNIINIMTEEIE